MPPQRRSRAARLLFVPDHRRRGRHLLRARHGGRLPRRWQTAERHRADRRPHVVLALGDNQYDSGELENFMAAYQPSWGRFKADHPAGAGQPRVPDAVRARLLRLLQRRRAGRPAPPGIAAAGTTASTWGPGTSSPSTATAARWAAARRAPRRRSGCGWTSQVSDPRVHARVLPPPAVRFRPQRQQRAAAAAVAGPLRLRRRRGAERPRAHLRAATRPRRRRAWPIPRAASASSWWEPGGHSLTRFVGRPAQQRGPAATRPSGVLKMELGGDGYTWEFRPVAGGTLHRLRLGRLSLAAARAAQTPQVPPYPTVTRPALDASPAPSARPFVCRSISSRSVADFFTLRYSTAYPLAANASRASEVWGQPSLPKMMTRLSVAMPSLSLPPRAHVVRSGRDRRDHRRHRLGPDGTRASPTSPRWAASAPSSTTSPRPPSTAPSPRSARTSTRASPAASSPPPTPTAAFARLERAHRARARWRRPTS